MTASSLPSDVVRTVLLLLEDLGTPFSLGIAVRLRYEDWDGLAALSVSPRSYLSPQLYLRDASALSILKKLQQLPTTIDRRGVALQKWWAGERECHKSNRRLYPYLPSALALASDERDGRIAAFFAAVRKKVTSWIGPRPPDLLTGRHGPGTTFSDRGDAATVAHKMTSDPTLTVDALWYLPQILGSQWGSAIIASNRKVSFVPGNRFTTVSKTSATDRAIAMEPSINVFFQLAMGGALRNRLRDATGWDLDTAQDIHRQVARESSVSREFATLDLSNASDTVSRALVRLCLPQPWCDALEDLRSGKSLIDGRWVVLEKFSSMGNGYTFELETILFAALCCVTAEMSGQASRLGEDVFVFGDDIIVRDDVVAGVVAVLKFCGFSLNGEKSFWGVNNPFRESCGGDYWDGFDVRPVFLKELPRGPTDYFAFANSLTRLSTRLALLGWPMSKRAWFSILEQIPTRFRACRGPSALGDAVIHDDESRWRTKVKHSIRYVQAVKTQPRRHVALSQFTPQAVLACATYLAGGTTPVKVFVTKRYGCKTVAVGPPGSGKSPTDYGTHLVPRDPPVGYKVGWMAFS